MNKASKNTEEWVKMVSFANLNWSLINPNTSQKKNG